MTRNVRVEKILRTEAGLPTDPSAMKLRAKKVTSMTFTIRNLSVLAYANGFTLWHYKAGKDRLETVSASNYFADASDMLAVGDMIMISAIDGARVVCVSSVDLEQVVLAALS